jgi:hypothetical protein
MDVRQNTYTRWSEAVRGLAEALTSAQESARALRKTLRFFFSGSSREACKCRRPLSRTVKNGTLNSISRLIQSCLDHCLAETYNRQSLAQFAHVYSRAEPSYARFSALPLVHAGDAHNECTSPHDSWCSLPPRRPCTRRQAWGRPAGVHIAWRPKPCQRDPNHGRGGALELQASSVSDPIVPSVEGEVVDAVVCPRAMPDGGSRLTTLGEAARAGCAGAAAWVALPAAPQPAELQPALQPAELQPPRRAGPRSRSRSGAPFEGSRSSASIAKNSSCAPSSAHGSALAQP